MTRTSTKAQLATMAAALDAAKSIMDEKPWAEGDGYATWKWHAANGVDYNLSVSYDLFDREKNTIGARITVSASLACEIGVARDCSFLLDAITAKGMQMKNLLSTFVVPLT